MVEIGYRADPRYRRREYARATVTELLRWAAEEPSVVTVRASISPVNAASLATMAGFGFAHVGEQWDEKDCTEYRFERPARSISRLDPSLTGKLTIDTRCHRQISGWGVI
jgi:RimJ/RimL family protein N-acetyltransferase